jgi:hypothetical protein
MGSMSRALTGVVVAAAVCLACGVPLKVTRLGTEGDKPTTQKGVRFRIGRPTFHVALALDEPNQPKLIVSQALDAMPMVFEAETDTNFLADTNISLGVDANERLKTTSAGETDRSKDIIEAAIALVGAAVKTRARGLRPAPPPPPPVCSGGHELQKKVDQYVTEQLSLIAARDDIQAKLDGCAKAPATCGPLEAEVQRRQGEIEGSRLPLDHWVRVSYSGKNVVENSDPCFEIALEEVL